MRRFAVIIALSVLLVCLATAFADVVVLKDGRRLEGKIVKETEDTVTLRGKYGEVEISRDEIAAIERGPTSLEEYRRRASQVKGTAEAHYELGRWCMEKGLKTEAGKHYREALKIDPAYSPAGKALGYEEVDGKWLSPDEAKKARGLVEFEGKWITKEERDRILQEQDASKQEELRKKYDVGPGFFVARRKHFVLVSDLPQEKRKELLEAAHALYATVKERFGKLFVKGRNWRLAVFAFSSRKGFQERVKKDGKEKGANCYGFYAGSLQRAYVFVCSAPDIVHMLFHECTHQIYVERMMGRGNSSCGWLFEGMAEYFEGHDVKGEKLCKVQPHAGNLRVFQWALQQDKLIPLEKMIATEDLNDLFGDDYASEDSMVAYAQAWAMVYYFLEGEKGKYRRRFERFMRKDMEGKGNAAEFKRIFGSDLEKIQSRIVKFIEGLQ